LAQALEFHRSVVPDDDRRALETLVSGSGRDYHDREPSRTGGCMSTGPTGISTTGIASTARQQVTAQLIRRGVSLAGAKQVLEGGLVASPGDRQGLAQLVREGLGLATEQRTSRISLVYPIVQSGSRPSGSAGDSQVARMIEQMGVSSPGASQFLTGLPVARADDRQRLALVVAAAAGGSRHAGGMNILMGDGSVRLV
jgi:prepilin-type processing-associated H-X9-DG protein